MKNTSDSTPETTKKSGRAPKPIDPRALEVAAARGLSQLEIADELGVSQATLGNRLKADDKLCAAYERGRVRVGKKPKASRKARSSAEAAPASEPAKPAAVKFGREEDAKVYAALQGGPRCRMELRDETGLTYDQINDALYRLRFEARLAGMVADKLGKEFFFILGDEEKAEARVRAASGGGPEAPPAPPQIVEAPGANSQRPARAVEAAAGESASPVTALAAPNGNGHLALPSSVPPPVHVPGLPPPDLPLRERAVRAALVEFGFIEFWGAPSNRFDDARDLLASAFGTFGGEVNG